MWFLWVTWAQRKEDKEVENFHGITFGGAALELEEGFEIQSGGDIYESWIEQT